MPKAVVNSTTYEVTGGKTLIDGTAYDINKGKTLIGGTAYDIKFKPAIQRLFEDMTIVSINGRNVNTLGRFYLSNVPIGSYKYYISIYNSKLTIWYISIASDSSTVYATNKFSTSTVSGAYVNRSKAYIYSSTGTSCTQGTSTSPSNSTVYGGTIAEVAFPSFTNAQVTSILSNATITALAGRNSSSTGTVQTTSKAYTLILAARASYLDIWDGTKWVKLNGTDTAAASISGSYLTCGSVYGANIFGIN